MTRIGPILLVAAGVACLATACWPHYSHTKVGNAETTRFSIGLPFSPWILFVREQSADRNEAGQSTTSFNQRTGIELVSWSILLLLAAQGLFFLAATIRKRVDRGTR